MRNDSTVDVQNAVADVVALEKDGLISIFMLAKLFMTISDNMTNKSSDVEANKKVVRYSECWVHLNALRNNIYFCFCWEFLILTLPPSFLSAAIGKHVSGFV